MTADTTIAVSDDEAQETIRVLQEELAATNREVLLLTLELEHRVEERTAELQAAQEELQKRNSELTQLTLELEDRVAQRTSELQQAHNQLEQRVKDRTAELEAANNELEAFSYSISHDLRSPLRSVDGFSKSVLDDYGSQLPLQAQRDLQTVRKGAQRMGELIDDLLTFARLIRQPLRHQTVNVAELVRRVWEELNRWQPERRKIELHIGELPPCRGDPSLLKQVWTNLLSNALKYSGKRETAVIEIGAMEYGNTGVPEKTPLSKAPISQHSTVYFVRDNGTGFDMRYAPKLFGVFQRLHRADEYEGTGVGLAIVQRILHRHGGQVWAEAAVDRGATFYFTLE